MTNLPTGVGRGARIFSIAGNIGNAYARGGGAGREIAQKYGWGPERELGGPGCYFVGGREGSKTRK